MIIPQGEFQPAHLARPLLPLAWHARTRIFLDDVDTLSAVLGIEIRVLVVEQDDGEIHLSALSLGEGDNEIDGLISTMCSRVRDATAYICVVCGELGECYQKYSIPMHRICCVEHCSMNPVLVRCGPMLAARSPWRKRLQMSSTMRMATSQRAYSAALSFFDRHNFPRLGQLLAEADALRARIAVDQITNSAAKSQVGRERLGK